MSALKTPSLAVFKRWAKSHRDLAVAVCAAKAFAELQREQVDAYIRPIFDSYGFEYRGDLAEKCGLSGPLPGPKELYLCDQDEQLSHFYEACDQAHRAHGFTGTKGHCPALVAEMLLIEAENHLIEAGKPLFGIENYMLTTEQRRKYLDLMLGACLIKERAAA